MEWKTEELLGGNTQRIWEMHESADPQLCEKIRRESRSSLELRQLRFHVSLLVEEEHEIPWENGHLGWMRIQEGKKGMDSTKIPWLTCCVTVGSSWQIRASYNTVSTGTCKERSAKCLQVLQWIRLQWNGCLLPGLECSLLGNFHWVQSEFCTAGNPWIKANKGMENK